MYKRSKLFWLCTVVVASGAFGQKKETNPVIQTGFVMPANAQLLNPIRPISILPANYSVRNLAFFCRQELQFEKYSKIPFRFRLGSVQETDRLEGKTKSILP